MVYKWAERFINWPNCLQAGWTVQKLAERIIPRMNGRNCSHFRMCGTLPSGVRVFQQALTVESNLWTTLLVLHLPSLGNVSARYCWNGSMLIVSGSFILASFIIVHVNVDHPRGPCSSHPVHVQARFLMTWQCRLIDSLSDSACPWPVINRADQFIIQLNG